MGALAPLCGCQEKDRCTVGMLMGDAVVRPGGVRTGTVCTEMRNLHELDCAIKIVIL